MKYTRSYLLNLVSVNKCELTVLNVNWKIIKKPKHFAPEALISKKKLVCT